jgi:hypothetical protein
MISVHSSLSGETRICPHCKDTILKSSTVCPACHHYLQFDALRVDAPAGVCPLRIEGTIRHPDREKPCEYSVVLEVSDEGGEVISRRVGPFGLKRSGPSLSVWRSPPRDKPNA